MISDVFTAPNGGTRNGDATRTRIMQVVREKPGINKSQIKAAINKGWGTVSYHVEMLDEGGALRVVREGRVARVYPASVPVEDADWLAVLRDDVCGSIIQGLEETPGARVSELADRIGFSRRVVGHHLRVLEAKGVIVARGKHARRYWLGDGEERLLRLLPHVASRLVKLGTPDEEKADHQEGTAGSPEEKELLA